MNAIVSNEIVISDCTPKFERVLRDAIEFDNPEYYKKLNRGLWVGNTPSTIRLYTKSGNDIIVPFGMLPEIFRHKEDFKTLVNGIQPAETIDYKSNISLYDYQEDAVEEALRKKQGIIIAPCGAGKTQIGLGIAARIGGRTLWLTHTQDLLVQSMERAKSLYGLNASEYGTITSGKINIGSAITFATVQTMSKIDLPNYRDCWDVIIVDEAHHVAGSPTKLMMFYKVISNLSARYKYGLTATPKREDGLTPCMYALLGEKICEIDREAVRSKTCKVEVTINQTNYAPDMNKIINPDGTLNYIALVTDITENPERNAQIVHDAVTRAGRCLILTDRVRHISILNELIKPHTGKIRALSGSVTKQERKRALDELESGEIDILIATYALAREGLDVPSLKYIIMATPQKNETTVTQAAGRVARIAPGKTYGSIIDYEDNFGMLRSWTRKRINIYRNLGYELQ